MNYIYRTFSTSLILFSLAACGGGSDSSSSDESTNNGNEAAGANDGLEAVLQGSWVSDCFYMGETGVQLTYSALRTRYQFDGNRMIKHIDYHDVSGCSDEIQTLQKYPAEERVFTIGNELITSSGLTATELNVTDQETNITKYTIIKVEDIGTNQRIFLGADAIGAIHDGSTEERRVSTLTMNTYYTKL